MTAVARVSEDQIRQITGITKEKEKYIKCWNVDDYRKVSPGERCVDMFIEAVKDIMPDYKGQTLIDFGCGTGRASLKLMMRGFDVTAVDFAGNCLDENVKVYLGDCDEPALHFVEHDITEKTALRADWGYCSDVMEHLPTDQIDAALDTIFEACENVFFQIATIPDHFGGHPDIKEQLHLTVWDYDKWLEKFSERGVIVHRSMDRENHVIFFVSGYRGFAFDRMKMNTSPENVFSQIRENLNKGLPLISPAQEQIEQKVIVLGGGPSLNNFVDEIKEHKKNGAKIITMNGTYTWAKEHDLWPVTQFMIDARPFNTRFIDPVDEKNLYIIAAQCHPDLIDKLPKDRTFLFQCNLDQGSLDICNEVLGEMYKDWFPVPGGSTVMLRCLPALQMLGYRDIEVYGFDSCFMGGEVPDGNADPSQHHAYEQAENDVKELARIAYVTLEGKRFAVEPWMLCQANEYINICHLIIRALDIKIHGNGLIAHCIMTGVDKIEE